MTSKAFSLRTLKDLLRPSKHKQPRDELRKSEARYRTVVDAAFDAIITITPDAIVRSFNGGAERIFGYRAEEVIGKPVTLLMPERYRDLCAAGLRRYLQTGEARVIGGTTELVGLRSDGSEFPIELSLRETHEDEDRLFTGIIRDITERKRAENALHGAHERFRNIFGNAPIGLALVSLEGRYLQVNQSLCEMLGYSEEELLQATTWQAITHPDDLEASLAYARQIQEGENPRYHLEKRYLHADGHPVWVWQSLILVEESESYPSYFVAYVQDITERIQTEEALERLSRQNEMVLNSAGEGIFGLDFQGNATFVNPAAARMTGWKGEELLGQPLHDVLHHTKPDGMPCPQEQCPIYAALETGATYSRDDEVFWRKDGASFPVEYVSTPIVEGDKILGAVVTFNDISERKALEEQLQHQAFHDPLTGLPNRALFMDRLEHGLARAGRRAGKVAVLFTDLDNFKVINDSLGHTAGDQLLIAVAKRLKTCLNPEDTIARLGGDEFTILLEDVAGVTDAARIAERIAEKLQSPFALNEQEIFVTISTGIAVSNSAQEQPRDLLRHADLAMYQAKSKGKARYEVFAPSMDANAVHRLELETELRRTIEREEFRVYYQPIVLMESSEIVGVEALVRWEHPERGLLPTEEFLPIAEESGLIVPIGQWVLQEACNQVRMWQEQHPRTPPLTMSVNLSIKQFSTLVAEVAEILRETGLDPRTLQLEITERAVMNNNAQPASSTLSNLKSLGVQLAIDDFGMGYSSLSYLRDFPVDFLKIDRSFVSGIGENPKDTKIVLAMIDLARALELKVICEGVETIEQLRQLRKMNCDLAQGYYFSEPLPSEAVSALLRQRS